MSHIVSQPTALVVAGAASWLWTALWGVKSIINTAFPGMFIKSVICQARCEIHDVLGKTPRYQHIVIILSVLKLEELCSVIYT